MSGIIGERGHQPARVLLVEDDETTRHLYGAMLEQAGFSVDEAENLVQAASLLDDAIDIALLDVRLKGQSGLDILKYIQLNFPSCPVIMISAHADKSDVIEALNAGAAGYLQKPIDPRELLYTVRHWVDYGRMKQQSGQDQHGSVKDTLPRLDSAGFRRLIEQMPTPILVHDRSGKILYANDACVQMMRAADKTDMLGKHVLEYVHPEDHEAVKALKLQIKAGKPCGLGELHYYRLDGSVFLAEMRAVPVQFGGQMAVQVVLLDITERKRAEEALLQANEFTDLAMDAQLDTFFVFEPATGKAVRWNRAFSTITGYTDEEIAGMPAPKSYYSAEDMERAVSTVRKIMQGGTETIEMELVCKDGRKIPFEYRASAIADQEGAPKYIVSIGRDISERRIQDKQMQEHLRQHELILQTTQDGFWIVSDDGTLLEVNNTYCHMTGYSQEELLAMRISEIEANENQEEIALHIAKVLEQGHDCFETRHRCKDGSLLDVEISVSLIVQEKKRLLVAFLRDISERKQAESELRLEKEYSERLVNTAQVIVLVLNPDATIHYFNPFMERLCGYRIEEVQGKDWFSLFLKEEERSDIRQVFARAISGDQTRGQINSIITRDGQERVIEWFDETLTDSSGEKVGLMTIGHDITESKQAEQELYQTMHDLGERVKEIRCLYNISNIGESGENSVDQYLGKAVQLLPPGWQYPEITAARIVYGDQEFHTENFQPSECLLASPINIQGEKVGQVEVCYLEERPNMDHGPFLAEEVDLIEAVAGHLARTILQMRTEVQLKRNLQEMAEAEEAALNLMKDANAARKALEEVSHMHEEAQEIAHLGHWELDLITNELVWSDENYRIFGAKPGDGQTYETFVATIHPDDRAWVNKAYMDSVQNKTPYDIEHRLLLPDGSIKWVQERCRTIYDEDGAPLRSIGTTLDITARKAVEQALFTEQRELAAIGRASQEVISLQDEYQIMQDVCSLVRDIFNAPLCWLGLVGESAEIVPIASAGPASDYIEGLRVSREDTPEGNGPSGRAVRLLEPQIVNDVDSDTSFAPWRDHAQEFGFASSLSMPLINPSGGVVAVMNIYSDQQGFFNDNRVDMMRTFANEVAIAIENVRLVYDLEERVRLRTTELEEARNQAEAANEAKSAFLANMSHELRTPLNSVIGFSELLYEGLDGSLNKNQKEHVSYIMNSGKHLLALINDILDISKIEAGRSELEFTDFGPAEAVGAVVQMQKYRAEKHGISFGCQVDECVGTIHADERRFRQVLINIIGNAVKFTPDGGSVSVQADCLKGKELPLNQRGVVSPSGPVQTELMDKKFLVVSVRDTGPGIDEQGLQKLFQPFQQLDSRMSRSYEGTGLGLALCKRLVEMQGGYIWVESKPGDGSTFGFCLPMQPLPEISPKPVVVDAATRLLTWGHLLSHIRFIKAYYDRHGGSFGLLHFEFTDHDGLDNKVVSQNLKDAVRQHEIIGIGDHPMEFYFILLDVSEDDMQKAIVRLCGTSGVSGENITVNSAIYTGGQEEGIDALLERL